MQHFIPTKACYELLTTNKSKKGIPAGLKGGRELSNGAISQTDISPGVLFKIKTLNEITTQRKQSLAQMAIVWLMKDSRVTSVLIGASSVAQLDDNLAGLRNTDFTADELSAIETILKGS